MTKAQDLAREHFGFGTLLPGQERVIEALLNGHSAAAIFPTGGGKSLCYQLPALTFSGLTLVVSPLLALMKDQIDALRARNIIAHRLDSTLSQDEYRDVMSDLRSGRARILYVAPERFNNERFRTGLRDLNISLFAIDEAHCISEWGHNFRPDYLKLANIAKAAKAKRVLALTATATPNVVKDIARAFNIEKDKVVRTPFYRKNLELHLTPASRKTRLDVLIEGLQTRPRGPSLVYVSLQKTAEFVAQALKDAGLPAAAYHAGLKPDVRTNVQDAFLASKDQIVVATIAFGMGVDKSDIRHVIHYNLPKSLENLAQEIGRAGRDGKPARCETLVCQDDLTTLENFAYGDTPTQGSITALLQSIFHGEHPDPTRDDDDSLALDLYSLAKETDIRALVLRTLLTWIELDGWLEGGTPLYAGYRFKPINTGAQILASVDDESKKEFLRTIFKCGKRKKTWVDLDVDEAASATDSPRDRIVRALDWLAEYGHIELKPSGVRQRVRILKRPDNIEELGATLYARMAAREEKEIKRLKAVVRLTQIDECQVRALGRYFGDSDNAPCGHCSHCLRGQVSLQARATPSVDTSPHLAALDRLVDAHPQALGDARQQTRLLLGLSSPALSALRLQKEKSFGAMEGAPFAKILESLCAR